MEKLITKQTVGMILLIILSFLLGKNHAEMQVIKRAQELFHQDKLLYDSSDINYVALGQNK